MSIRARNTSHVRTCNAAWGAGSLAWVGSFTAKPWWPCSARHISEYSRLISPPGDFVSLAAVYPSISMDSPDDLAGSSPPHKKRRKAEEISPRSLSLRPPLKSSLASRRGSRASPRAADSGYSLLKQASRSRSSSRSRSRSCQRSSSPSISASVSRSESRPPSCSRSFSRDSVARSTSSCDPPQSDSLSPRPPQLVRPREPIRPKYKQRIILHGHTKPVSQVRISPNGRFIASASADATLKIWDTATGAHMDTLVGHMAGVSCLAWTSDSNALASGSDDKAIRLWDRVTGRPKMTSRKSRSTGQRISALRGHHNYIHCLAFSPKGNILASGSYDEAVFLWDVRAARLMRSLPAHSDPVSGIDFCRDGTLVVSCSTDGLIRVWDTSTGQCLRTLVHEDNPAVTNVCFSPNGRFVLAFSLDNCIRLWDYDAGTVKKTYQGHRNERFSVGGCFGVLDGEPFVASASEDGNIVLWEVRSKDILQRVPGHQGVCFWVDVHGETMVSAGHDHTVRVYRHTRDTNEADDSGKYNEEKFHGKLPIRQEEVKLEDA